MNSPESKKILPDNDPKLLNSQYNNRIERDPLDNDPQLLNSQYDNKLRLEGQCWIRTPVVQERTFKQQMLHVSTKIIIIVLNR